MPIRVALTDFALKNPYYAGSACAVYEVNENLQRTATLATLYAAPTGATLRPNPMVLDSEGKFPTPLYAEKPIIIVVTPTSAAAQELGVQGLVSRWRGVWATGTLYYPGERVRDPAGPTTYIALVGHVSNAFATDVSNGLWQQEIDANSISSAAATSLLTQAVAKTGDQEMTGNLSIKKATPFLYLDASGTTAATVEFRREGKPRWRLQQWTEADPNFLLAAFDNTGAFIGNVVRLANLTRKVTFLGAVPDAAFDPMGNNDLTRKAYVDTKAPMPTAVSGAVGLWRFVYFGLGSAGVLPAGGTWAWFFLAFGSGGTLAPGSNAGVNAGGTTVVAADPGQQGVMLAWRVA